MNTPTPDLSKLRRSQLETDPRCRKTHRVRIDFESPDLRWYCETCHADLELDDTGVFVLTDKGRQALDG